MIYPDSREILFEQLVAKYNKQCNSLAISPDSQPFLKLKDRRGDNAKQSRGEYLYEIYLYVKGITDPRYPKSPP